MPRTVDTAHANAMQKPVKLLILSDLHLEHRHGFEKIDTDADIVVLAGDIHVGVNGIAWARNTFADKPIVYVAGNHEFYGHRWDTLIDHLHAEGRKHEVHFPENDEANILGLRFLGSTMWTDFKFFGAENAAMAMNMVQRSLADYRVITKNSIGHCITAQDTLERHKVSHQWMKARLSVGNPATTVVVTHHYPCRKSTTAQYVDDPVTAGFGSHLESLMGKSSVWIHGHTHTAFDYEHKGTRVVCNPKGYVSMLRGPENPYFNAGLVVTVGQ